MKEDVAVALLNLHRSTNKEWIALKEIYEEVEAIRKVPNANAGASIRRTLETYTKGFDTFQGEEKYISNGKGTGLYKSIEYDRLKFIGDIVAGDVFTIDQLMNIFDVNEYSDIMFSGVLNCIIITVVEDEFDISSDGMIQYTNVETESINIPNQLLVNSKENKMPVYLFSKDDKNRYTFEGEFVLSGDPYQVEDNGKKVYKFPFKLVLDDNEKTEETSEIIEKISDEVVEISNEVEVPNCNTELVFKPGPLEIRKYRKNESKNSKTRSKKPDYIAEQIVKSKQGELNEKLIYKEELKEVLKLDGKYQAELMEDFFKNKKENEGYDILSFELGENGDWIEKYIEVKSTKGSESTPIDITANEIEFAKSHVDNYYLYRIINSESNNRYVKIVSGKELLNDFNFVPETYKIYSA